MKNNYQLKALFYASLVFSLVVFLWWFQGGSIFSVNVQPSPQDQLVIQLSELIKEGTDEISALVRKLATPTKESFQKETINYFKFLEEK